MVWGAIAGKVLGKGVAKKTKGRQDNPYFEYKPVVRSDGRPSKSEFEKRKKKLPPGLNDREQKALQRFKDRAYNLDMRFGQSCGTAVVIGAVPGIGDVLVILIALSILLDVRRGSKLHFGVYNWFRLLLNVGVDGAVGLVPILGDIVDAFYKCNTRNASRLDRIFQKQGQKRLAKQPGYDEKQFRDSNRRHEAASDNEDMGEIIRGPRPTNSKREPVPERQPARSETTRSRRKDATPKGRSERSQARYSPSI